MARNMFAWIMATCLIGTAQAAVTLSASMTADNYFDAFISTSPTLEGVNFLSGSNWPQTYTGSTTITAAGTYYLHVIAGDLFSPCMLIGSFSLDSTDGTFINGSQSLVTNTVDWTVSVAGLGINSVAPTSQGLNGTNLWGNFPLISPNAEHVWHPNFPVISYFSTPIVVVPAPGIVSLLGLAVLRRRR